MKGFLKLTNQIGPNQVQTVWINLNEIQMFVLKESGSLEVRCKGLGQFDIKEKVEDLGLK